MINIHVPFEPLFWPAHKAAVWAAMLPCRQHLHGLKEFMTYPEASFHICPGWLLPSHKFRRSCATAPPNFSANLSSAAWQILVITAQAAAPFVVQRKYARHRRAHAWSCLYNRTLVWRFGHGTDSPELRHPEIWSSSLASFCIILLPSWPTCRFILKCHLEEQWRAHDWAHDFPTANGLSVPLHHCWHFQATNCGSQNRQAWPPLGKWYRFWSQVTVQTQCIPRPKHAKAIKMIK